MKDIIELYKLAQNLEIAKKNENYPLALEIYNQIIKLKLQLSNRFGIAKSMAEKANLLEHLGFHQKALEEYLQAFRFVEDSNNREFSSIIDQKIVELNKMIGKK
ncbi:MAG: hypothetical protein K9W44_03310 [Candidatus Lokiarchaeota archaeon]|nr:hypothetical protein [Candidatus Harpocratesius repetitus]